MELGGRKEATANRKEPSSKLLSQQGFHLEKEACFLPCLLGSSAPDSSQIPYALENQASSMSKLPRLIGKKGILQAKCTNRYIVKMGIIYYEYTYTYISKPSFLSLFFSV